MGGPPQFSEECVHTFVPVGATLNGKGRGDWDVINHV